MIFEEATGTFINHIVDTSVRLIPYPATTSALIIPTTIEGYTLKK